MRSELKIDLKKLSSRGLSVSYSQKSEKLTQKLSPLIGESDYSVQIHIQSAGPSSYSISGQIQAHLKLLCARCAYEFQKPVQKNFREKILLQKKRERIDKPVRSNHFSELTNTEDWNVTDQPLFDIGDFLYELLTLEEPLRPLGSENCDSSHCEHLEKIKQNEKVHVHFS